MNQREEQRVVQALQAFSGSLTVTEHDIIAANNRLKGNLEPPSPRRRLAMAAIVAAAAIMAAFFIFQAIDGNEDASPGPAPAPAPSSPAEILREELEPDAYTSLDFDRGAAPTARDLAGIWLLRPWKGMTGPMHVTRDGSYRYGTDGPYFETSSLSGQTWIREVPVPGCPATQSFTAGIAGDGSLHLQVAPEDNSCTITDGREVWDSVAGGSPVADYLLAAAEDATWEPTARPFVQEGLYVAPRTGHLLEVSVDAVYATYRFYDEVTADRLVAADQGEMENGPGTVSGTCGRGAFTGRLDSAPIPGVDELISATTAIRITADADSCASGFTADEVWVRLVPGF